MLCNKMTRALRSAGRLRAAVALRIRRAPRLDVPLVTNTASSLRFSSRLQLTLCEELCSSHRAEFDCYQRIG